MSVDGGHRSGEQPAKNIDAYEGIFEGQTQFFTTLNPDDIETVIEKYCKKRKTECSIDQAKYLIDFEYLGAPIEPAEIDTSDSHL